MPGLIACDDVSMTFPDGTQALSDVQLEVAPGEFVSVVGPSGCGKSTLLRLVAGLLTPTSGTVVAPTDGIGFVFQDPTLMPWRTVQRNVEYVAELNGVPRHQRRTLAQDAIDIVGLSGFEGHYPRALSGGMRMRCSLARSLALRPPVMLFDEPFGAIDEINREALNNETLSIYDREQFSALFITHSITEAVFMSDRVLVMSSRPGRMLAEFVIPFERPRPPELRFTAEFVEIASRVSAALRSGFQ